MKRRSILIAASPHSDPALGVYPDMRAWETFLRSGYGGAWKAEEVILATDWGKEKILSAITSFADADYSVVIFAGHAHTVKTGLPWKELQLLLGTGELLMERELNPGTPRCAFVLDCCRSAALEERVEFSVKKAAIIEQIDNLQAYRVAFDQAVMSAEGGLVKIYATEDGSDAEDEDSFSQHLIFTASEWAARNRGTLSLREGVDLAAVSIAKLVPQQKPEYRGGRRLRHFPIAVSI